jgi:hypothetical protein
MCVCLYLRYDWRVKTDRCSDPMVSLVSDPIFAPLQLPQSSITFLWVRFYQGQCDGERERLQGSVKFQRFGEQCVEPFLVFSQFDCIYYVPR